MSKRKKQIRAAFNKADLSPRLAVLLHLFFADRATNAEILELEVYLEKSKANDKFFDFLIAVNRDGYAEKEMKYMLRWAKVKGLFPGGKWKEFKTKGLDKIKRRIKTAATFASITPDAARLLALYFNGQASQEENNDLDRWINESKNNDLFFDLLLEIKFDSSTDGDIGPELAFIQELGNCFSPREALPHAIA